MTSPATSLEEEFFITRRARLHRWLPWLSLFRSFRLAIGLRRMTAAYLAILLWVVGVRSMETLRSFLHEGPAPVAANVVDEPDAMDIYIHDPYLRIGPWIFRPTMDMQNVALPRERSAPDLADQPALRLLSLGQWWWPGSIAGLRSILLLVGSLLLTAIFGGAVCRMTAVEFAGQGDVGLGTALTFAAARLPSATGAPLSAWLASAMFWGLTAAFGLVATIPVIGATTVAALWPVPLLFGFLRALILLGVTLGWPLMVAAVNVERTDAFDALSRAYSYLFNRGWYALFLGTAALVSGCLSLFVVWGLVQLTARLAAGDLAAGMGDAHAIQFFSEVPSGLGFRGNAVGGAVVSNSARALVGLWMQGLLLIPQAFVFSYFWTAATIIYFHLRLSEDGTPLTEVDMAGVRPAKRVKLPLVGIPAANLREKSLGIVRPGENQPGEQP